MAFSTTKFPVQAWKLMPSFKPVQVTLLSEKYGGYETNLNWRVDANDLYRTKAEAIAAGKAKLDQQQMRLENTLAQVAKKRAELEKAEARP